MAIESEEKDSFSFSTNEKLVIDTIRRKNNKKEIITSKNTIAELTQMPWSSVSNIFQSLIKRKVIHIDKKNTQKDRIYSLNNDYGYFVGISLGTSRIKIVILDYCFHPLEFTDSNIKELSNIKSEYKSVIDEIINELEQNAYKQWKICYDKQCNSLLQFIPVVSAIVDIMEFLKSKLNINILAISFVFPGSIDFENRIISDSYVLEGMSNVKLSAFLTKRNMYKLDKAKIVYSIDHNAKAAIIAEKEIGGIWDSLSNEENLMCLYLGYGIGSAYILKNDVYRGNRNDAGQIGHNQVIPRLYDLTINPKINLERHCRCGRINCLEHRIREDVFGTHFDIKKQTAEDVKLFFKEETNQAKLKLFARYLGEVLCNNLDTLSIDNIVFSGKFSELFDLFENELNQIFYLNKKSNVILNKSNLGEFSAAIGAAIEAYNWY